MTPSARIQAVLELLLEIENVPRPADALVSAYFRARRYIGSHDRGAVSTMLYDVLRHRARMSWWVERFSNNTNGGVPLPSWEGLGWGAINKEQNNNSEEPPPHQQNPLVPAKAGIRLAKEGRPKILQPPPPGGRNPNLAVRSRLLAYLILVEKKSPKQIENFFDGNKFSPTPLSEDEKKLLLKLENHTAEHPDMPDDVRGECPKWAAASLHKRFEKSFMREMQALLEPAPLDLRVNAIKADRDDILTELKKLKFKAGPCPLSPYGIRIAERPNLTTLPMLKNGLVEIQDEGSQMIAAIVDAKPGMRVVDFCAGAGGKTLAIAAQMNNKGRITACDVLAKRLTRSTERFRRAGVHNIETKALTNERDPWVKKRKGDFDRVLVDAPCTGVGAWRRNPDARWRSLGPGLEALIKLQADILDSAARLVKKGGKLIYATCSLLPEENEQQIEKFLATHADFKLSPYKPGEDYLSLTPAQHNTDGFFGAVMEKPSPLEGEDVKT